MQLSTIHSTPTRFGAKLYLNLELLNIPEEDYLKLRKALESLQGFIADIGTEEDRLVIGAKGVTLKSTDQKSALKPKAESTNPFDHPLGSTEFYTAFIAALKDIAYQRAVQLEELIKATQALADRTLCTAQSLQNINPADLLQR